MKEATGELNMTVITIVLIGIIAAFFVAFWPNIKNQINDTWNKTTSGESSVNADVNVD